MSLNTYWQPVTRKHILDAPNEAANALRVVFGHKDTLTILDTDRLEAMFEASRCVAYKELVAAIEKHGEIRVWSES